jgi:hypothetical protein
LLLLIIGTKLFVTASKGRTFEGTSSLSKILHIKYLLLAGGGDGRGLLVLDRAGVAAAGLNGPDNALGLQIVIGNLAENDVLSVEPRSDNGGDEELGAVATKESAML